MATTKKTTKKTAAKRFVSAKEYDAIKKKYYALTGPVYRLIESGKLNATAQGQLKMFHRAVQKAFDNTNWYRATNYNRP